LIVDVVGKIFSEEARMTRGEEKTKMAIGVNRRITSLILEQLAGGKGDGETSSQSSAVCKDNIRIQSLGI
jgi:hypothetical protein